jgi:hypothetical protein
MLRLQRVSAELRYIGASLHGVLDASRISVRDSRSVVFISS